MTGQNYEIISQIVL